MTAHNVITGCNTSGYFPGAGPKLAETTPPANKSFLISCSKIKISSKTGFSGQKQPWKIPDCRNLPPDKAKERAELVVTIDVCGISPTCILNSERGYFVQIDAPWRQEDEHGLETTRR